MGIRTALGMFALVLGAGAAQAADCGAIRILNKVQMTPMSDGLEMVPFLLNGTKIDFLFDTGGVTTQIGADAAAKLKLPVRQGYYELYDATGNISRSQATVAEFSIGILKGKDATFPISYALKDQGILSLNYLTPYDIDVDFGTGVMNFFSQDHCPGAVMYWKAPAVAVLPILVRDYHLTVPITLDGREMRAVIDTGASNTALRMDVAQRLFEVNPGSPDTPAEGYLNGDTTLPIYHHVFRQLTFGDIQVNNPRITIMPDAMNRNGDRSEQTGNRARQVRDDITAPEVIIGMNVLKKLHVYFAFGERKLYVTPASAPVSAASQPAERDTPRP